MEVCGGLGKMCVSSLFKMQKAVGIITCSPATAHSTPIFLNTKILLIENYIYSLLICLCASFLKNCLPDIFSDLFICNQNIYNRVARQACKLHVPKVNLLQCKKSIRYLGVIVWN